MRWSILNETLSVLRPGGPGVAEAVVWERSSSARAPSRLDAWIQPQAVEDPKRLAADRLRRCSSDRDEHVKSASGVTEAEVVIEHRDRFAGWPSPLARPDGGTVWPLGAPWELRVGLEPNRPGREVRTAVGADAALLDRDERPGWPHAGERPSNTAQGLSGAKRERRDRHNLDRVGDVRGQAVRRPMPSCREYDPVAPPPTLVALPSDLAGTSGPIVASPSVRSLATANQRQDRDRSDTEHATGCRSH